MIPIGSLFFYVGRGIQKIVRPGQTAAKERPAESQVEEQDRAPRKISTPFTKIFETQPHFIASDAHPNVAGEELIPNLIKFAIRFPVCAYNVLFVLAAAANTIPGSQRPILNPKLRQAVFTHGTGNSGARFGSTTDAGRSSQAHTPAPLRGTASHRKRVSKRGGPRRRSGPSGQREPGHPDEAESSRPYACPFLLFDPEAHSECRSKVFMYRTSDVRTHISRRHSYAPSHCPVCFQVFENDPEFHQRDVHVEQRACQTAPNPHAWATPDQLEAMGTAAREGRGLDHLERWYVIWDILFAPSPRPVSPYINRVEMAFSISRVSLSLFLNQLRADGSINHFLGTVMGLGNLNNFLDSFMDYLVGRADDGGIMEPHPSLPHSTLSTLPERAPEHPIPQTDIPTGPSTAALPQELAEIDLEMSWTHTQLLNDMDDDELSS